MRHERQIELLRRLKDVDPHQSWPLASHSMRNAASAYTDAARFEDERRVLFRRRPQMLGLSAECAAPGAYITADLGGVPALVVRQANGLLKGFVNACRHGGAPVAERRGPTAGDGLHPYHGWVYVLEGTLAARPYAEAAFDDVPKSLCSLLPIFVAEGYGLIFAQAEDGEGLTADNALAGAQEEIGDYGLKGYALVEARENTWKVNWKLILDTFTESYHIRTLHKNSIAATYSTDVSLCNAFGPHPQMIGLLKSVFAEVEKPEADWQFLPHTTLQYIFMPSGLITYQRDHIELWRVTPLAVDRTLVRTSLYAPEAPATDKARAYWKKNLDLLLQVTGAEDFPLMEKIQANLASGALPELIYGKNEPALIHLHRSINEALASAGCRVA